MVQVIFFVTTGGFLDSFLGNGLSDYAKQNNGSQRPKLFLIIMLTGSLEWELWRWGRVSRVAPLQKHFLPVKKCLFHNYWIRLFLHIILLVLRDISMLLFKHLVTDLGGGPENDRQPVKVWSVLLLEERGMVLAWLGLLIAHRWHFQDQIS